MKFKFSKVIFLFVFILLVLFQIKTTNIKTAYTLTPHEIDLQIKRMNMYPGTFGKLGYLLEVKKESQIFEKLQNNFFTVIDFNEYFPNRLPFILSPFLFIGLYFFICDWQKRKEIFYSFLLAIALLTVLGPHAKYGPVLLFPYLIYFIALGFWKIFKLFKK